LNIKSYSKLFDENYIKIDYEWFTFCDRNCSYCYNVKEIKDYKRKKYNNQIEENLIKLLSLKYEKIIYGFLGGEIFLHPNLKKLISIIEKYSKKDHKFIWFTHAQHKPYFFKKVLNEINKLNNIIDITLHFENLNKDYFEKNLKFALEKYPVFLTIIFNFDFNEENKKYVDYLLNRYNCFTMFTLEDIQEEGIKRKIKFEKLNKKFIKYFGDEKYDKNSLFYQTLNNKNIGWNSAKKFLKYNFQNMNCKIKYFDIKENGEISYDCINTPPIGFIQNFSQEELNEIFQIKNIICPYDFCSPNITYLDIEEINE